MTEPMKRISKELDERIKAMQIDLTLEERRPIKYTEASRVLANSAITSKDDLKEALRRLGKHRLFP